MPPGPAIGLAAYLVHGFFDYFLEFTPTYGLLWLLAGIVAAPGRARYREGDANDARPIARDVRPVAGHPGRPGGDAAVAGRARGLVGVVPTLKPPVAAGEYAHLLLVFLPTWIFAADRLGIHRLQTITGEKLEIIRRVILTQAWGVAAIGLILTFAQVSLNRSLIFVFLVLVDGLLLVAKAVQAPWLARRRGQSRVLLIGDASDGRGGRVRTAARAPRRTLDRADPAALEARFPAGGVDEVVLVGRLPPDAVARVTSAPARRRESPCSCRSRWSRSRCPSRRPTSRPSATATTSSTSRASWRPACWPPRRSSIACWRRCSIVLFAPIMLLIALAVLIGVGSPVLFVQRRGGLYGHPFPDAEVPHHARRRRAGARRARGRTRWTGRCSRCATIRA